MFNWFTSVKGITRSLNRMVGRLQRLADAKAAENARLSQLALAAYNESTSAGRIASKIQDLLV